MGKDDSIRRTRIPCAGTLGFRENVFFVGRQRKIFFYVDAPEYLLH